ncbi:MAG: DUF4911 domain-containing protein [Bacillota bacterium]|nr:DUF4911 domain-containing protein [Bacillota bacterium]
MDIQPFILKVQTAPKNIDFLNKVFEAYDNLGIVSTVDSSQGLLLIRGFGKLGPIRRILRGLPFAVEILEENQSIQAASGTFSPDSLNEQR